MSQVMNPSDYVYLISHWS